MSVHVPQLSTPLGTAPLAKLSHSTHPRCPLQAAGKCVVRSPTLMSERSPRSAFGRWLDDVLRFPRWVISTQATPKDSQPWLGAAEVNVPSWTPETDGGSGEDGGDGKGWTWDNRRGMRRRKPCPRCGGMGLHPCAWCGTQDGHLWDFNPIAMGPPLGAPSFGLFPLVFERVPCPKCAGTGKVTCKACIQLRRAASNRRFQYKPAHPLLNGLLRTVHMRWKAALVFVAWRVQRFQQSVVSVNKKYVDCLPHEWPITPRGSPFHENLPTPPTHHIAQPTTTRHAALSEGSSLLPSHALQPISPRWSHRREGGSMLPGYANVVEPISPRGPFHDHQASTPAYSHTYSMASVERQKRR